MTKQQTIKFLEEQGYTLQEIFNGNVDDSLDLLYKLLEKLDITEDDITEDDIEDSTEYMKANDYDRF